MNNKLRVVELFAGVGGFRLGLEGWKGLSSTSNYKNKLNQHYEIVWSNQFEPSTKRQHASEVYEERWGNKHHSRENIEVVIEKKFKNIPQHDLLVGGFPCQDYSVATTLKNSKGLVGKKGVLWWSIYNILKGQGDNAPSYLFLENVDRLLVSPASQRGRDFAIMLSCLNELGYAVEWRVINAADYGMPQRRRRVYILGYRKGTSIYQRIKNTSIKNFIFQNGVLSKAFPIKNFEYSIVSRGIDNDIQLLTKEFNLEKIKNPFFNTGLMLDGTYHTAKTEPNYYGEITNLGDIVIRPLSEIDKSYIINPRKKLKEPLVKVQIDGRKMVLNTELDMWKYLKGTKKEYRRNKALGYDYQYAEGAMSFPDELDNPSRTIITGEGGSSPSRFKHVIVQENTYRRLMPSELEKLNMFPKNHTKLDGVSDTKRAFLMGNALVVGVVEKIGQELYKQINLY
ncbi:DNA (cytosine-5-)-methyltransferase [Geojedonia litorea]|uniref:Cytosine-specific methyltransferase n=1 Tax=Geojedonia litorea TaxID=1268269 RepID=A0ABV9MZU4_9FLAO